MGYKLLRNLPIKTGCKITNLFVLHKIIFIVGIFYITL